MDFMSLILLCIVYTVAYLHGTSNNIRVIKKLLEQSLTTTLFPVYLVEYEQGNYYLYDKETMKFVCQGTNLDEIASNLLADKKIGLAGAVQLIEDNLNVFWIVNGKIRPIDQ